MMSQTTDTTEVTVDDLDLQDEPTDEQSRAYGKILGWAIEQGISVAGVNHDGSVLDADGNEHQSPYEVPEAEWEIGVEDLADDDVWEWYHPRGYTRDDAVSQALRDARNDGMVDPEAYEVSGPYEVDE